MSDLGPSLVDGIIRYVSPSQLEKYDERVDGGCARKWWFRYVAKVPDKDKPAARLGEQVHQQLEHFARTGDYGGLGPIASVGRHYVPFSNVKGVIHLEQGFGEQLHGAIISPLHAANVPVIGRIDVINNSGIWLDDESEIHYINGVEVLDWKTTGQILDIINETTGIVIWKGWAKSAIQIASSWQMLAYGEVARRTYDPVNIRLSHVYFQTKRPFISVKRTSALAAVEVHRRWTGPADALVEMMKSTAGEKLVKNVPVNLKACSAFGGCPYKDSCPRDSRAVFANLLGGSRVSILERRRAATNNEPVKADPLPSGRCPMSGQQRTLTADEVTEKIHKCICGVELKIKPSTMPDDTSRALVPEHDTGVTPEKPKKASKVKIEEEPKEYVEYTAKEALMEADGYSFYVDIVSLRNPLKIFNDYVTDLVNDIATQFSVVDIRCAPNDSAIGFGRWKGALAAAAKENLPSAGKWFVDSRSELQMVVYEALSSNASEEFRKVG